MELFLSSISNESERLKKLLFCDLASNSKKYFAFNLAAYREIFPFSKNFILFHIM